MKNASDDALQLLKILRTNTCMKTIKKLLPALVLLIAGAMCLSGCDEDWWTGTSDIDGTWIIDQIDINPEYRAGDAWTFDYNGRFYADGEDGLSQNGDWMRDGRNILIRFDDSYTDQAELVCTIRQFAGDSMELYVTDYGYNQSYRVILIRSTYYAPKRKAAKQ